MILTLTLNPAVDQTIEIERLDLGQVNRYARPYLDPAGKGVNVSRMVHRLGGRTIALGFLAGEFGQVVARSLEAEGVEQHFVPVPGQTRINVTIVESESRRATGLYGPGPRIDPLHGAKLEALLADCLPASRILVLAGSLPPGVSEAIYARFIRMARERRVATVLDADGTAMRLGVEARPDLIKPNVQEAERLLDRRLPDLGAIIDGARELASRGVGTVVVSMGADGAVCVAGGRVLRVVPPRVEARSTVGSGDSFIGGMTLALRRGEGIEAALRLGAAAGAATAAVEGTALGMPDTVARLAPEVRVSEVGASGIDTD